MLILNSSKKINKIIKRSIVYKHAISIGKIGNVESAELINYLQGEKKPLSNELFINAGIYIENTKDYLDWCEAYLESIKNLDYILDWNSLDKPLINQFFKKKQIFKSFIGLEPFQLNKKGWHYFLDNKTTLCVSPFSKSVQQQSKIFHKIWPGANLGKVETVDSPHSEALTGTAPIPWKKKFKNITDNIDQLNFDFATIGCGGLSLLVCNHIKKMGIPNVHLGGGNQVLYGIKGKRWDQNFKNHAWYGNEYWKRPELDETPMRKDLVENGCYW